MSLQFPPTVLIFAGNDPSGGAGLAADIQALASVGCHAAPIVTSITVQDTHNVITNTPLPASQVVAQAEAVLADLSTIVACKIGLLGSAEIVKAVASLLSRYPHLPVILDPILAAGGGHSFATEEIRQAMIHSLFPLTYILTPNSQEARALCGNTVPLEQAAYCLLNFGCRYVCITGTHEDSPEVKNILYGEGKPLASWTWERLLKEYHGSGCTFAASLAGLIAGGHDILTAVAEAQRYTWTSLQRGYPAGRGQALPNRLFTYSITVK